MTEPRGPFWPYWLMGAPLTPGAPERLLYVGKTNDPQRRLGQHIALQPFAGEITRCHLDLMCWYATEREMLAAEAEIIKRDRPLFNICHNQDNPDRVDPRTMRYAAGPQAGQPYRPELYAHIHGDGGLMEPLPSGPLVLSLSPTGRRIARWGVSWAAASALLWWAGVLIIPAVILSGLVLLVVLTGARPGRRPRRRRR